MKFVVELDDDLPKHCFMDQIRMRQVLLNIVGNAIKFTKSGDITIKVRVLENRVQDEVASIDIIISDTGIGIPEEDITEIFKSFRQQSSLITKNFGGTGLGLSISRKLVEMMGGEIFISSKVDHGTVVTIRLKDLKYRHECEKVNEDESFMKYKFMPSRILAVDDEPLNIFLISELIDDPKVQVDCANNGNEAYAFSMNNKYDLIIMDLLMPGKDGMETAKDIRQLKGYQDVPIICFSANITQDNLDEIKGDVFDDYLPKPVGIDKLMRVLGKYLKTKP